MGTIRERNGLRRLAVPKARMRCAQLLPPVLHRRASARCDHRPGNVHDSNGDLHAVCVPCARAASGKDRGPCQRVLQPRIDFTPWGPRSRCRSSALASQRNGRRQTTMASHGGRARKPRYRFIFIRKRVRCQSSHSTRSVSVEYGYEFKVHPRGRSLPRRGSKRESLPSYCLGVPVKTRNQLYMLQLTTFQSTLAARPPHDGETCRAVVLSRNRKYPHSHLAQPGDPVYEQ